MAAAAGGCQPRPTDPGHPQPNPGASAASGHADDPFEAALVGALRPVEAIDEAVDLYEPRPATYVYRRLSEQAEQSTLQRRFDPASVDGGAEAWVQRVVGGSKIKHMRRDADGNIRLAAVEDTDRNVISRFEPGLVTAPARFTDRQHVTESRVTVVARDDPNQVKHTGKATMRVRVTGRQRVRVPAGEFDAYRIEGLFDSNFGAARVSNQTISHRAPGVGVVLEQYTEKGVAVIVPWTERRKLMLIERRVD